MIIVRFEACFGTNIDDQLKEKIALLVIDQLKTYDLVQLGELHSLAYNQYEYLELHIGKRGFLPEVFAQAFITNLLQLHQRNTTV